MSFCVYDSKNITELELFEKRENRKSRDECFGQVVYIALTPDALKMMHDTIVNEMPEVTNMFIEAGIRVVSSEENFENFGVLQEAMLFEMCVAHWLDITTALLITSKQVGDKAHKVAIDFFKTLCVMAELDHKELHNLTVSRIRGIK